jgi:hypothetical protein
MYLIDYVPRYTLIPSSTRSESTRSNGMKDEKEKRNSQNGMEELFSKKEIRFMSKNGISRKAEMNLGKFLFSRTRCWCKFPTFTPVLGRVIIQCDENTRDFLCARSFNQINFKYTCRTSQRHRFKPEYSIFNSTPLAGGINLSLSYHLNLHIRLTAHALSMR